MTKYRPLSRPPGRFLTASLFAAALMTSATALQAQMSHVLNTDGISAMSEADIQNMMASAVPAERLLSAPPSVEIGQVSADDPRAAGSPVIQTGQPGRGGRVNLRQLNFDAPEMDEADAGDLIGPQNYGFRNENTWMHYNDYLRRPYPVQIYPWRAAGKLHFVTANGQSAYCSAALIARSIIVTAGHCLHDGGNGQAGWIQSGFFVPAASGQNMPYNYCTIEYPTVTDGWYNVGALNMGYDVGVAACSRPVGASGYIGGPTGWFSFCHRNCLQTFWFLTQLGYPSNYYNGNLMTVSQHVSHSSGINYDYIYGSGMRGGSSGGPHVSNIGDINDSSSHPGMDADRNVIFAVTSWGYNAHAFKMQGASPLSGYDNTNYFRMMYNQTCRWARQNVGNASCAILN